jgi:hypothetical protein
MGQKVQPTGFRLGITEDWRSRWYADKNYAEKLGNDLEIVSSSRSASRRQPFPASTSSALATR